MRETHATLEHMKDWFCILYSTTSHSSLELLYITITVLLHNSGFCYGCITKRIFLLQALHS
jgi:hypothetical protein